MTDRKDAAPLTHPLFLSDEAANEDFFGSHNRVADSIVPVLDSGQAKIIGLLGPWGSGKSTVLKLVEKKLSGKDANDKTTYFFYFDAWLHQNDPPRRSFLETFVQFLVSQKLTVFTDWQHDFDRLNRRAEEHDITTTPTLTASGKIVILALLLFPIGLQLISKLWLGEKISVFGFEFEVIHLGILFLIAPILAGILAYIIWRPTLLPWRKIFWTRNNWVGNDYGSTIFSLFVNKSVDRVKNRIIRTPDPTAIEFQEVFRKLMTAVSAKDRKYVFIIDNLDRIPEVEAITVWSTIRSFFIEDGKFGKQLGTDSKIPTVILPLDPGAVRRMYDTGQDTARADELARSFFDKTFDLTFRISPPVQSGWQDYFAEKMREVLQGITDQEIYTAVKLYESYLARVSALRGKRGVTPRNINVLVNDIALLKLQWKSEIKFATMAYYAINRNEIEQDLENSLITKDPDIGRFDEKWTTGVAAIHYGVPVDRVMQVLIQPDLKASIALGNADSFGRLSKTPGFDAVLEKTIEDAARSDPPEGPEFLSNAAYLIKNAKLPRSPRVIEVDRNLRQAFSITQPWRKMTANTPVGLTALIESCEEPQVTQIAQTLATKLATVDAEFYTSTTNTDSWAASALAVYENAAARGVKIDRILVPGQPDFYFGILKKLSQFPNLLRILRSDVNPNVIVQEFVKGASTEKYNENIEKLLKCLIASEMPLAWPTFASATGQFIQTQPVGDVETRVALRCLGILRRKSDSGAAAELKRLSDEGHLFNKLHQAHTQNAIRAEASIITMLILTNPTFAKVAIVENAESGYQLATNLTSTLADRLQVDNEIDQQAAEFGEFKELVDAANANPAIRPLIQRIFSLRLDAGRLGPLHISDIKSRLPLYLGLLDQSHQELFIRKLPSYKNFWREFEQPLDANMIALLNVFVTLEDETGDKARSTIIDKVKQYGPENWQAILETGNDPLALILILIDRQEKDLDFGEPLLQALRTLFEKALLSGTFAPELVTKWYRVSTTLSGNSREILFKDVRDRIVSGTNQPGTWIVLVAGGGSLLREGQFQSRSDDAVRYVIIPLVERQPETLKWFSENDSELKTWISNADPGTRGYLTEKLASQVADTTKAKAAIDLAEAWKIRLPKPPSGDEQANPESKQGSANGGTV